MVEGSDVQYLIFVMTSWSESPCSFFPQVFLIDMPKIRICSVEIIALSRQLRTDKYLEVLVGYLFIACACHASISLEIFYGIYVSDLTVQFTLVQLSVAQLSFSRS